MFLTHQQFKRPTIGVKTGVEGWNLMQLSSTAPWFLVVREVEVSSGTYWQTVAAAEEATLESLIRGLPAGAVQRVTWLAPSEDGGWMAAALEEVWASAESEKQRVGDLLARIAGESELRSAMRHPVAYAPGRVLLWQRPSRDAKSQTVE